ncbi:MAG: HIT family protein [Candidatus Doudnabacteria bacterium]|nr:HIT family protein [Candidatus Doudnabacteria bacterium]
MQDCIFCKIVEGSIPSNKVYEDDQVLAFLDIRPVSKGHTLVIPKKHSQDLLDTDDETLQHLLLAAKKVSRAVVKATGAQGFNLGVNNGKDSGQEVMHLHFHIIPRYVNDGLSPWPHRESDPTALSELAKNIKQAF